MTDDLARRDDKQLLPEAFVLPQMISRLDQLTWHLAHPHPDIPALRTFDRFDVECAESTLKQHEPFMAPASLAVLTAWLWPIADGVEYTPTEADFFRRVRALEIAASDVPHVAWTLASQRRGLLKWSRFPAVGGETGICALVGEDVAPLLSRVRQLRRIVESVNR
jgi:hypothetical protein